jgi:hypothetical protein
MFNLEGSGATTRWTAARAGIMTWACGGRWITSTRSKGVSNGKGTEHGRVSVQVHHNSARRRTDIVKRSSANRILPQLNEGTVLGSHRARKGRHCCPMLLLSLTLGWLSASTEAHITCYNCGQQEHIQAECKEEPFCIKCNKEGHLSAIYALFSRQDEPMWVGFGIEWGGLLLF